MNFQEQPLTVEALKLRISQSNPQAILVMSIFEGNRVDLDWSSMPLEVVCYMAKVLETVIQERIIGSLSVNRNKGKEV